jgi:hypothetical protein
VSAPIATVETVYGFVTTPFRRLCSTRLKDASFLADEQRRRDMHPEGSGMNTSVDDRGGHPRAMAAHARAAETHGLAAELHQESANLHEEHAAEMLDKGLEKSARRAERIADRERELADGEHRRADKHRRLKAQVESDSEDQSAFARPRRAVLNRLRERLAELDRLTN